MARFGIYKATPPIVLLTDFGFKDSYVGVMKGVIRRLCRDADIIDLSHNVMPQDVAEAAFVLAGSFRYFPEGAIFTCVVDPGVGSDRAVLCMRSNKQLFLAPDNGLLNVMAAESKPDEVRKVTAEQYFLKEVSTTFHGRDIFAPVAAHLAMGLETSKLGPLIRLRHKLRLPKPVRTADGRLRGQAVYIDQFGNLITNIQRATLARSFDVPGDRLEIRIKRRKVRGISKTYSDRKEGELVGLVGSSGYLEVAVNGGSAAQILGCEKGDAVTVAVMTA